MATEIPALRVSGVTLLMLLANASRIAGAVMLANGSSPADGTALNRADSELPLQAVQVTATREAEPVERVPASISVISGDELQARGASDLRTALSLLGGVEGTAGGDNGPAGAVPALWGLREADAFLLVVDGVPWGGAFNPATPSIDLTGVERIEVLRGAAPVMFGATSFVGVIHVIHYAAGQVPAQLSLTGGAPGTYGAALRTNLRNAPSMGGGFEHSLFADIQKQGYREYRSDFGRYHALYRASGDLGAARLKLDGDITVLRQIPSGSLLLRDGQTLHNERSDLVNYNPSGAQLNQERYQLALSLEGESILGRWSARAAFTRTLDNILRGFLRGEAFADPPDAGVGDGLQADGYSQKRGITDVYIDLHVTRDLTPAVNLTYGVDYLHGQGSEHAVNFGYCVNPDGQEYPCEGAHHDDEIVRSDDKRDFAGLYSQVDLRLLESLDVLAGVRLNHTRETASGMAIDNTGPEPVVAFDGRDARTRTRPSGTVGASWRTWSTGRDSLTLYADYRNTYKPLAVDFGPEAEVQILKPETASSYELGAKGQFLDGRMSVDASVFRMDFSNGLTFADEGGGDFRPVNGGATRFKGVEIESRVRVTSSLQLMTSYAWHDPRYVRDSLDDGTDISGKRIEMSPRHLGGLGMLYAGSTGVTATLVVNCVSARELNKTNTLSAGGYTMVDASVGYHLGRYQLQLNGYNLTDRRAPVSESELQGSVTVTGTAGYYRLTGRAVAATLTVDLPFAGGL